MKQFTTIKQFEELSKVNRKKLEKWIKEKYGYTTEFPLLSIGQMIEFLDEKGKQLMKIKGGSCEAWSIHQMNVFWKPLKGYGPKKELCDALWEAVKEIMER